MNQNTPTNNFRIPTLGLIAIGGLFIALIAVIVFKVAIGTVIYYSFIAVMILSHFWMHAGHGNHKNHQEQIKSPNSMDSLSMVPVENNDPKNRKHGCH
jgi:hypothetical protein